jgi:N-acyl-D-amino-acid deacylase
VKGLAVLNDLDLERSVDMSRGLDLKITNGLIVDGTGQPAYEGDIGVRNGKIVAVGEVAGSATMTMDATNRVVSPGFIDIHTHYDAQMLWDPMMTISPYHGVTTAFMGNCGFGVAPARPSDHELIIHILEKVEGMPFESTFAALEPNWGFETYPQYLDALAARSFGMNVCLLVPHTAVRVYVMGEAADQREATPAEIAAMARIVKEGVEEGAWGFSTSNHKSHIGYRDRMAPSVYASYDEYRALILAMSEVGRGTVQAVHGETLSYETMARLSMETGRNFTSALIADEKGPGSHLETQAQIEAMQKEGSRLWPQVSPRPFVLRFTIARPNFFAHVAPGTIKGAALLDDLFTKIASHPTVDEQIDQLKDPAFREDLRNRTSSEGWRYLWSKTVVAEFPERPELTDRVLADLAREQGKHPADTFLDLGIASRLTAVFALIYMNGDEEEVSRLLKRPGVRLGVTDAGAHVAELNDAGYPSHVLGRWVRERKLFTLEEAIEMLSSRSASLFGITDRGTLRPGFAADIVVFDPDTIAAGRLRRVYDLPKGADRLVSDAHGIDHVIVNGTPMISSGKVVARQLPGRLLRSSERGQKRP